MIQELPGRVAIQRAHDQVYQTSDTDLVRDLTRALGRPTIARLTNAADLKTITRWSLGRNRPSTASLERIRHAAVAYYALLGLGLSTTNAEQWFRGANPVLSFTMPVDSLRDGHYAEVLKAVESYASE